MVRAEAPLLRVSNVCDELGAQGLVKVHPGALKSLPSRRENERAEAFESVVSASRSIVPQGELDERYTLRVQDAFLSSAANPAIAPSGEASAASPQGRGSMAGSRIRWHRQRSEDGMRFVEVPEFYDVAGSMPSPGRGWGATYLGCFRDYSGNAREFHSPRDGESDGGDEEGQEQVVYDIPRSLTPEVRGAGTSGTASVALRALRGTSSEGKAAERWTRIGLMLALGSRDFPTLLIAFSSRSKGKRHAIFGSSACWRNFSAVALQGVRGVT